jgi:tetratricopeptide (TPR) repeat protein
VVSGRDLGAQAHDEQAALANDPENPVLLHQLGRTMSRLGQHDLGLQLVGQAIARAPSVALYRATLATGLALARHPDDAREEFTEALRLDPGCLDARAGLADLELDRGDLVAAGALLAVAPGDEVALARPLGRLALAESRWEEATRHLFARVKAVPIDAGALFYLGVALQSRDMLEPAAASYRQAVTIDPELFEAHANLSTALGYLGETAEALVHAEEAVRLAPDRAGVYLNRANARRDLGDLAGAVEDLHRAIAKDAGYAEAWSSLGNIYHDLGELSHALDAHARAVQLAPHLAQAHWNRSFSLFAAGELALGWTEYEGRRGTVAARPEPRDFPWPEWAGEPLAGRRLLVWREQGLGDELLFATCIPDLIAAGAHLTLLVSPRLTSIVRRSFPGVTVRADEIGAVHRTESFDWQVSIASLPRWLRSERSRFPTTQAILRPSEAETVAWTARLSSVGPGRKIGLCWRSGLVTPERKRHYAPLEAWQPVLTAPGVQWINLQYDDCEAELIDIEQRWGVRVHRWPGHDLRNNIESVLGLIANLEGVVTAPTAVSSLAGAVGVRTWQVDSGSDWTAFGEDRSPWFPSIELVRRQADEPDWNRVMTEIARGVAG